jgi:hypothetical protein
MATGTTAEKSLLIRIVSACLESVISTDEVADLACWARTMVHDLDGGDTGLVHQAQGQVLGDVRSGNKTQGVRRHQDAVLEPLDSMKVGAAARIGVRLDVSGSLLPTAPFAIEPASFRAPQGHALPSAMQGSSSAAISETRPAIDFLANAVVPRNCCSKLPQD